MPDAPQTAGQHLDAEMAIQHEDIIALRHALAVEQARTDLLWELARRRGWVSDEEASVAKMRPP